MVELVVTIAIAAILAALAAPTLGDFIVRSKMVNASNDFAATLLRVRNEAVSRNTCVTLCMSDSAGGSAPACTSSGADWQVGWIAFLNTSCDGAQTTPTESRDVILARTPNATDIKLLAVGNSPVLRLMMNPRGAPGLGNAGQFNLQYQDGGNSYTTRYGSNICLDALGRSRAIPSTSTCSTF